MTIYSTSTGQYTIMILLLPLLLPLVQLLLANI
jgi:hypothetical protein